MNKLKNVFSTIFIITLLFSCSNEQKDIIKPIQAETPKALQDSKLEIKSYSRSGDLIDELYQELVDKNPALKKLEDDIETFRSNPYELNQKFQQFDDKSKKYYSSVNNKAATISDGLLRNKISALITSSNKKYSEKTSELNSLLNQISKNDATLNDHHTILKIVLTLPLIETYQDENKPDKKEYKNLIKQQEYLIIRADSLTPKN